MKIEKTIELCINQIFQLLVFLLSLYVAIDALPHTATPTRNKPGFLGLLYIGPRVVTKFLGQQGQSWVVCAGPVYRTIRHTLAHRPGAVHESGASARRFLSSLKTEN